MSDFMDDLGGLYKMGRGALDLAGVGEVISIASTAKDMVPGAGFTPGADKVMGPLGYLTSGIDLFSGGYQLAEGIDTGNSTEIVDGTHDAIAGTAGMLGNAPGPVGAVAKSFAAGMAIGDLAAPYVFGSEEEDNKAHTEEIPEDGVFKPSTGNRVIDAGLDLFGIRD